jgi:hypothetical protein
MCTDHENDDGKNWKQMMKTIKQPTPVEIEARFQRICTNHENNNGVKNQMKKNKQPTPAELEARWGPAMRSCDSGSDGESLVDDRSFLFLF